MASYYFGVPKPPGGNWAYMLKNREMIGEFIRANELKPAVIGQLNARAAMPAKAIIDLGIRGGMLIPHLHFNNKIYVLNDKQWSEFSKGVIADCKASLAQVKEISFDQAMALGSLTQELAGTR